MISIVSAASGGTNARLAGSIAMRARRKAVTNIALEQTLPVRAEALPGKAAQSRVRQESEV